MLATTRSSTRKSVARRVAERAAAILLGITFAGAVGEMALRYARPRLPPKLTAFIANCYDPYDRVNGIYYMDPRLGLTLPRPNFSTVCSWNGYTWQHSADARGFRNPTTSESADIVILGDSIVYGHGVEEEDTIAARLRARVQVPVVNLGVTGASPVHYVAFTRNYALRLRPKAVVVVVFANDLTEIEMQRNAGEILTFSRDAEGRELEILPTDSLAAYAPDPGWMARFFGRSFFIRALDFGAHALAIREAKAEETANTDVVELTRRFAASVGYLRTSLRVLSEGTARANAKLVVVYVPSVQQTYALEDRGLPPLLSEEAQRLSAVFVDATPVLMDGPNHAKEGTRLALDGHLSRHGAFLLSASIASRLDREGVVEAPHRPALSIGSPSVTVRDFWPIESDEKGAFAWTRAKSALEITGFRPGARLGLALRVRHLGACRRVTVTTPSGRRHDLEVSIDRAVEIPEELRTNARGGLSLSLETKPFRPSEDGDSTDGRELGITVSGIEVRSE
jgi:hypothetical protein